MRPKRTHTTMQGRRHTHWHTRSLWIVEAAALGHVLPAPRQASSPYSHPRRGNRDPTGPISYRTSAKISPTRGSNPAKGLIASLCTSVNERASARCAVTDKRDHHLECQANSEARFKCGRSELALCFASIPTHFTQFVLHRPPISHANVSNLT